MGTLTVEISGTLTGETFCTLHSAISSLASAVGRKLSVSLNGQLIVPCGPALAHASPSASPGSARAHRTNATCGQPGSGSLNSAGRPSSSANKSQQQLVPDGLTDHLICVVCETVKPLSGFYKSTAWKDGYRRTCKICFGVAERTRKALIPAETKAAQFKAYRREKRAKVLLALAKHRAKLRGLPFSLSETPIQTIIDAGYCQLTGIPFNLDNGKTWDSPSIDRINSVKGYTPDNVRVILYCINVMANTWGENKIIEISNALMATRRRASEDLQNYLTESLKARINLDSSPEFALTWKTPVTLSGRPYCRLAASTRHTSGNGFGLWPTPLQADCDRGYRKPDSRRGAALTGVVAWPTPMAKDWKSGQVSPETHNRNARPLNEVATLVAGFGETPSSSSDPTEKRGALNPEFVCWLMGFPPEWLNCADSAMPSFPRVARRLSKR
jgi:hypothetical protein